MFTFHDILQACGKRIHLQGAPPPDQKHIFPSAQHDSRQVRPGDLFVAIKGAQVDGHSFIPTAFQAGANAVLCTTPSVDVPPELLQIVVPDVIEALHSIAHYRTKRQKNTTMIGITGSTGKTSTKEAVAAVLSRKAPTLKTYASYNTEVGYPLTLLRLEPEHRYAVLELGAQWVGELAWLCNGVARPHWAIITNVGASHLEFFGSQEQVVIAKSELVQALPPKGIAILNYDDINVRGMSRKTSAQILYYGLTKEAHVHGSNIAGDALHGHSFTLNYAGKQARVQLHLPGEHGVMIALAAAAAGCAAEISLEEIREALEELLPAKGRCQIKPGPNGSTLIDDTYNASRQSIFAIAKAMQAAEIALGGKRWAVLSDILELGHYARAEHRAAGEELFGCVDYLIALGDQARFYVEGAIRAGIPADNIYYFDVNDEHEEQQAELEVAKHTIADLLKAKVQSADLVLVKGSRGMHMETLVDML